MTAATTGHTNNGISAPREATILTLEARVQVLMVGSRQVTMSVFNQLDEKPFDQIKLMGRVRAKDGVWVIGSDDRGNLVRGKPAWPERVHSDSRIDALQKEIRHRESEGETSRREEETYYKYLRELEVEQLAKSEYMEDVEQFRSHVAVMEHLPLIVLAGLR